MQIVSPVYYPGASAEGQRASTTALQVLGRLSRRNALRDKSDRTKGIFVNPILGRSDNEDLLFRRCWAADPWFLLSYADTSHGGAAIAPGFSPPDSKRLAQAQTPRGSIRFLIG